MGIFGNTSPLETDIEKATSENNTTEKWAQIMDVCDKIGSSQANAKESLRIITKRLNHADPHVIMQAITLLDACVNNCGKNYHLEIASREFEQEFKKLVNKSEPQVANKLKTCLKKWAEGDFKTDPQLNLIPTLYKKMKQEGHDFIEPQVTVKREIEKSNDPNVVSSQQEEDDIAKAIELSLKEKKYTPSKIASAVTAPSSLYPSMNSLENKNIASASSSTTAVAATTETRKVRALYDFEAAEDNELTFKAGEIIMVFEESDPNWWRGTNHRGEGYFPANFVTADLSAEPEDVFKKETRKSTKSNEITHTERKADQPLEINEEAIDRLLFLLHEADPEDPSQDSDEMLRLESFVNQMSPMIDTELERVDRKHAQLTQLSSDLIDTINLYHSLMRDTEKAPMRMLNNNNNNNNGYPGLPQYYPNNAYAMNTGFPQMPTPENYQHLMHPQHLNQNQMPSLPPQNDQMLQQQFPPQQQHHMNMPPMMGQMQQQQQLPSGIYHNSQTPQDSSSRVNSTQDINQAAAVAGIQHQQQSFQNPNLAQNFNLPPMQQNRMVVPQSSNFPMTSNQMMPHMQLNEMNSMMGNMSIHTMNPMNYPPIQQDASAVPIYHQQP